MDRTPALRGVRSGIALTKTTGAIFPIGRFRLRHDDDTTVWLSPLPGHTPGHMGVLIADGSERLLIWGDIVHLRILQMPHPDWTVIWDTDPAEEITTRRRILDRAAV